MATAALPAVVDAIRRLEVAMDETRLAAGGLDRISPRLGTSAHHALHALSETYDAANRAWTALQGVGK